MANGRDRDPEDLFCAAPEDLQCQAPQQAPRPRQSDDEIDAELAQIWDPEHGHDVDHRGEWGYAYGHNDQNGTTFGAGVRHEGENLDIDGPHVNFGIDNYNNRDGEHEAGVHLEAGVLGGNYHSSDPRDPSHIEGHVLTAEGGVWDDGSTFNVGAGFDLAGASGELALDQGSGDHRLHANRNDDTVIGANLSAGGGLGFRVHHGDEDGDGVPELGLGFSVGPGGVDARSEYLGQAWNAAQRWWDE